MELNILNYKIEVYKSPKVLRDIGFVKLTRAIVIELYWFSIDIIKQR